MHAPTHDDATGSLLAQRYRLDALLGRGAMGAVYRALDLDGGHVVAVKVMHAGLDADPQIVERFTREAEAAACLDHPNCVQVLAAGTTTDGTRFLVMPLLEGTELRHAIAGGMALRRTVDIVLQVLAGLAHAHAHGFVHRDVKPENVLLVADGRGGELAKLVDFGLVKPLGLPPGRALTSLGRVFGTPWYMAPEQAAGEAIDTRADLYAVGAMMFEMLTGAPPFDGDSLTTVLHKHMLADVPALPGWLPLSVAQVIRRLLEKRPQDRYATADAAAEALRAAMVRVSSSPTVLPMLDDMRVASMIDERPVSMLRAAQRDDRRFGWLGAIAATIALTFGVSHLLTRDVEATELATPVASAAAIAPMPALAPSPAIAAAPPPAEPDAVVVPPDAVDATPRASGADDALPAKPAVTKPRPKPSVPAVTPSRPQPPRTELPPPPSHERKLEASRPPRNADKLPGTTNGGGLTTQGGVKHLRPRAR